MRVLLISNMYPSIQKPYSGIFVKNQYEALRKKLGPNIHIKYMKRRLTNPIGSILKYLFFIIQLFPVYFKRYEVIHFHYYYLLIFLIPYKWFYPKTKFVVTFHGQDIIKIKIHSKLFPVLQYMAQKVDCSLPVGKKVAIEVESKLNIKTFSIIPVGVNEKVFYPHKNELKIYDFIFVGSFYHVKGIDIIVKAIKQLDQNAKNMRFCFVGTGPYKNELSSLNTITNIDILGPKTHKELRKLYNCSRFFLSHSRSEGFPTAPLEAMYCGIPVLASNIQQCKEQVINAANGWLVELGNVNALSNKILLLTQLSGSDYKLHSKHALKANRGVELGNITNKLVAIYKHLGS